MNGITNSPKITTPVTKPEHLLNDNKLELIRKRARDGIIDDFVHGQKSPQARRITISQEDLNAKGPSNNTSITKVVTPETERQSQVGKNYNNKTTYESCAATSPITYEHYLNTCNNESKHINTKPEIVRLRVGDVVLIESPFLPSRQLQIFDFGKSEIWCLPNIRIKGKDIEHYNMYRLRKSVGTKINSAKDLMVFRDPE
jgi:hypothetical protein